jgi:hypothetical protein
VARGSVQGLGPKSLAPLLETPALTAPKTAQAKALGDVLVVGLIPDSEILRCKGPPVLNEKERYLLVDAVKWVDEVVSGERTAC